MWKPVIQSILETDSSAIDEILSNLVPASTAANMTQIFQSKDSDTIGKKQFLHLLAFCIYSCPTDYFFILLPLIHERIVELLRRKSYAIQTEVLYVILFLVLRLSPRHITNLWSIIITELIRILEQFIEQNVKTKEERMLLLAAYRLFYVILSLRLDEFQYHQWMFFPVEKGIDKGFQSLVARLLATSNAKTNDEKIEDIDKLGPLIDDDGLERYGHFLGHYANSTHKTEMESMNTYLNQIFLEQD